jgi:outer membrane protein assembly factor BamD
MNLAIGQKNYFCAMFLKRLPIFLLVLIAALLASCDGYQKVLKSTDLEYKYEKAVEYYDDGKYAKSSPIFDELLTLYRGTQKAKEVYYYYAMTQYQLQDYLVAAYHFKTFYQTFPNHQFAEESAFMVGFCYYKESPTYSLDQANTYKAMNELQLFVNTHRNSPRVQECNALIDEMRQKLERKSFEIAKQYWHTENYRAAVEALSTTLNEFPDTRFREEAMYLKLDSSFKLAKNSIVSLQAQRFKQTLTAYYDLIDAFPQSAYKKQADRIFDETKILISELNTNEQKLTNS